MMTKIMLVLIRIPGGTLHLIRPPAPGYTPFIHDTTLPPPLLLVLGALFGSSLPVLTADRQNCDIMPPKRLFQTDNVSSRLF